MPLSNTFRSERYGAGSGDMGGSDHGPPQQPRSRNFFDSFATDRTVTITYLDPAFV